MSDPGQCKGAVMWSCATLVKYRNSTEMRLLLVAAYLLTICQGEIGSMIKSTALNFVVDLPCPIC